MHRAIGILDSGVGGLTVVKEVIRQLPREKVIYFGDNQRCPYGPRTSEEVKAFTLQIVEVLLRHPLKLLVIACNTAAAAALDVVRSIAPIPVVSVIHPGVRAAIKVSTRGSIGVIGTEGTIRSKIYEHALKQINPELTITSLACPEFVPLVEQAKYGLISSKEIVKQRLTPLKRIELDSLILGCTHYPLLWDEIAEVMGPDVTLISSADETAREISAILHHNNMLAESDASASYQFFTSGNVDLFRHIAEEWLGQSVEVTPHEWERR